MGKSFEFQFFFILQFISGWGVSHPVPCWIRLRFCRRVDPSRIYSHRGRRMHQRTWNHNQFFQDFLIFLKFIYSTIPYCNIAKLGNLSLRSEFELFGILTLTIFRDLKSQSIQKIEWQVYLCSEKSETETANTMYVHLLKSGLDLTMHRKSHWKIKNRFDSIQSRDEA